MSSVKPGKLIWLEPSNSNMVVPAFPADCQASDNMASAEGGVGEGTVVGVAVGRGVGVFVTVELGVELGLGISVGVGLASGWLQAASTKSNMLAIRILMNR